DIIILIKLEHGTVISFKQRLHEPIFYILPRSYSAGKDLFQQLSRQDQLIKRIFWDEKYVNLLDKNKTHLMGISLDSTQSTITRQDYRKFLQKLKHDSRVNALFNTDLSDVMQFIYTQLRIPPTSKIKVEYVAEQLLSIERIDDSNEVAASPFSIMYIENLNEATTDKPQPHLVVRTDGHTESLVFDGISDPAFISFITQKDPDIVVFCGDGSFTDRSNHRVVIYSHTVKDVNPYELVEKARFSYLPLKFAARYGMIRLIESRITYELIQRGFVIPARTKMISKHHEQIRTLEDVVEMDKAGMIVSPEIGLHENVAVLDFNDEYANLILNHNISYETLTNRESAAPTVTRNQIALLPSIIEELVSRRIHLKRQLKEDIQPDSFLYHSCEVRLETLKQILVCLYGTSGSIWNRYSNVRVFEEINRLSREILMKTKDIAQSSGFDLIYAVRMLFS
ncbi:MAG TPA: DNA polymerase domain-containing protein, partial [Nitrososphaeraceae archaeon]|nr:DNA polymerase domain-containing protein [Nitrososphaeraceae archaeon]